MITSNAAKYCFMVLCVCVFSWANAKDAIDGYSLIETNPDIELHHVEREFLRATACYNSSIYLFSESREPGDRKRKLLSKLLEAEREAMDEKKRIISEIRISLSSGGRLFWAQKRDDKQRESGYIVVRDGQIVGKWLSDWATVQKDGSLKTSVSAEPNASGDVAP